MSENNSSIGNSQRIAIVGTGISGLLSAYLLHTDHEVTVFEASDRIGGHTHTVDVKRDDGTHAVDTGFIVFNNKTYPNFTKLMKKLGVEDQASSMTFSVKNEKTGLEYQASTVWSFFSQRINLLKPKFWRMIKDIRRFETESLEILNDASNDEIPLGEYLKKRKYSDLFVSDFIIPMGAAIWSSSVKDMMEFPAKFFIRFFHNHGFLTLHNQPQWKTLKGGSRAYLKPLTRGFSDRIHISAPVTRIRRTKDSVFVTVNGSEEKEFDHVVIATHSDQALKMLSDPTQEETAILGAIPYQPNDVVLHSDASLLPKSKRAWSSWNYHLLTEDKPATAVSYNMNILQRLRSQDDFIVTLNRTEAINPNFIHFSTVYEHPLFGTKATVAQARREEISGKNRTHYCGAYWRNGFHEDGAFSALAVAKHFGKELE